MSEKDILYQVRHNDLSHFNGKSRMTYPFDHVCTNGSTFLTWAIRTSYVDTVSGLLRLDRNFHKYRERGGATPLMLAIHLNRLDMVKVLVNSGADIKERDSYDTPLTAAVGRGHLEIIEFLIDRGADVEEPDLNGLPPLIKAVVENKKDVVDIFFRKEKGVKVLERHTRNTPLLAAIQYKTPVDMIERLLDHGVDPHECHKYFHPLHLAVREGNLEAVKVLLKKGTDVNLIDKVGDTALAVGVQSQNLEIVEYLIDNGASVCKFGRSGCYGHNESPLHKAVETDNVEMIKLLLDHGAHYTIDDVFPRAIMRKSLEVVQLLTERGAQIRGDDSKYSSPLRRALDVKSVEIAKYLIEKGASVVEDVDQKELLKFLETRNFEIVKLLVENGADLDEAMYCGDTPLTKAIKMGNFDMVRYFLAKGASFDRVDGKGNSPLAVAEENGDFRIFEYLVDCGATVSEEEQAENAKLGRCYRLAKESSATRAKLCGGFGSNQEEANGSSV